MESLGETIKNLREEKEVPLRKVAAYLDIDQAVLSKFEHGTRMPQREHIVKIAAYFKIDDKPLLVKWLAGKVLEELAGDELSVEAIKLAEAQIKHRTGQSTTAEPALLDYIKLGEGAETEIKFSVDKLPSFIEFAAYLINTIAGKKLDKNAINNQTGFIGEGADCEIYLFYKPDIEWLKNNALTLNMIKNLPPYNGKVRLVFASLKYVNDESCRLHHVKFGKIPY